MPIAAMSVYRRTSQPLRVKKNRLSRKSHVNPTCLANEWDKGKGLGKPDSQSCHIADNARRI